MHVMHICVYVCIYVDLSICMCIYIYDGGYKYNTRKCTHMYNRHIYVEMKYICVHTDCTYEGACCPGKVPN